MPRNLSRRCSRTTVLSPKSVTHAASMVVDKSHGFSRVFSVVFWLSLDSRPSPTSQLGRDSWRIHSGVWCVLSLGYSGIAGGPKSVSTGGWLPQRGALERERRPMILVSLDSRSTSRLHPLPISINDMLTGELSRLTYGFARCVTRARCLSSENTH
jgi:hypothetical protein